MRAHQLVDVTVQVVVDRAGPAGRQRTAQQREEDQLQRRQPPVRHHIAARVVISSSTITRGLVSSK